MNAAPASQTLCVPVSPLAPSIHMVHQHTCRQNELGTPGLWRLQGTQLLTVPQSGLLGEIQAIVFVEGISKNSFPLPRPYRFSLAL